MPQKAAILAVLERRQGAPQLVREIARQIPGVDEAIIAYQCAALRELGFLERSGLGTLTRPYRFALKRTSSA
ncbi:MAG: hypothetical protein QM759_13215 [Terricaulis sp.]